MSTHRCPPALAFALRILLLLAALAYARLAATGPLSLQLYASTSATHPGTAEERVETLHLALRLNPAQGWAWHRLSQLELGLRHIEAAQHAAEMATMTLPSFRSHAVLAQILFARSLDEPGQRFATAEVFDRILRISPGDQVLLNRAARIALWNNDLRNARRYLERLEHFDIASSGDLETLNAQNRDTIVLRMELAHAERNSEELLSLIELLLTIDPESHIAVYKYALLLAEEFDAKDVAYEILRDQFEPGLPWPDYVELLTRWAVERSDHWTLWHVLGDLWARQAERKIPDPGLNALVDNVQSVMIHSAFRAQQTDLLTDIITSDQVLELARNPESRDRYDRYFSDCIRPSLTWAVEMRYLEVALRMMEVLAEHHRVYPETPEAQIQELQRTDLEILQWEEMREAETSLTLFLRNLVNRRLALPEASPHLATVLPQALELLPPHMASDEQRPAGFEFLGWLRDRLSGLENPPESLWVLYDQILIDIADVLLQGGEKDTLRSIHSIIAARVRETSLDNPDLEERLRQIREEIGHD